MERGKIETDPSTGNNRAGLMITRRQIGHLGHVTLKTHVKSGNAAISSASVPVGNPAHSIIP